MTIDAYMRVVRGFVQRILLLCAEMPKELVVNVAAKRPRCTSANMAQNLGFSIEDKQMILEKMASRKTQWKFLPSLLRRKMISIERSITTVKEQITSNQKDILREQLKAIPLPSCEDSWTRKSSSTIRSSRRWLDEETEKKLTEGMDRALDDVQQPRRAMVSRNYMDASSLSWNHIIPGGG